MESKRAIYLIRFNSHTHKALILNDQNFYGNRVELNPSNVVESQNSKQVGGAIDFYIFF